MFIVDGLISQGVNVISGASKIGKSGLMLWLGLQVAQGNSVWGLPTPVSYTHLLSENGLLGGANIGNFISVEDEFYIFDIAFFQKMCIRDRHSAEAHAKGTSGHPD